MKPLEDTALQVPVVSVLNFIVKYSEVVDDQLMGPPVVLLHEALVKEQADPSSTWNIPFVKVTEPCVSSHLQCVSVLQELPMDGVAES
jgi:hypothetical protein